MDATDTCCCGDFAKIGRKIRPFTLETYNPAADNFEEVRSEDLQTAGKWTVLVFYPADFTFVCPTELADLADSHQRLTNLGVELISVSTDSKYSHLAWRKSERLLEKVLFQMGSDPTGALTRYFAIYDEEAGTANRGTYIINPDGVLIGSEVTFYNVGRNAAELVRKMEANVHLRAHPDEACPARWEPGQKTLLPTIRDVGKVFDMLRNVPRGM